MNKEEKDKLYQYGKPIVDFVNGENTDQILTDYVSNLQSAFNFSHSFINKALQKVPTIKKYIGGKLSDADHQLFDIVLQRNEIFNSCIRGDGDGNNDPTFSCRIKKI